MLSTTQSLAWLSRASAINLKYAYRGLTTSSQYTSDNEMYRFRSHIPQQNEVFNFKCLLWSF